MSAHPPAVAALALAGLAVLLVNLPFGYWRAGTRKFSWPWLAAVHLPVPIVVAIRFGAGLGFHPVTYPALVGAYFTGQYLGGRLRSRRRDPHAAAPQEKADHESEF